MESNVPLITSPTRKEESQTYFHCFLGRDIFSSITFSSRPLSDALSSIFLLILLKTCFQILREGLLDPSLVVSVFLVNQVIEPRSQHVQVFTRDWRSLDFLVTENSILWIVIDSVIIMIVFHDAMTNLSFSAESCVQAKVSDLVS